MGVYPEEFHERKRLGLNDWVLIVEDDGPSYVLVRDVALNVGFQHFGWAKDGEDALSRLKEADYPLVICDWMMHPMPGLELLRGIRADQRLQSLYFIMITALQDIDNARLAREAGADDYIIKPVRVDMLSRKLGALLEEDQSQ